MDDSQSLWTVTQTRVEIVRGNLTLNLKHEDVTVTRLSRVFKVGMGDYACSLITCQCQATKLRWSVDSVIFVVKFIFKGEKFVGMHNASESFKVSRFCKMFVVVKCS